MDLFFQGILSITGWGYENCDNLFTEKKLVIVYPHTSHWDAAIGAAFRMGPFSRLKNVKLPLWHTFYDGPQQNFFDKIGFIPVYGKGGFTNQVTTYLSKLDQFVFAISPEGQLPKAKKWRSGFYHIAKQTGAKIAVVNLDYMNKKLIFEEAWHPTPNYKHEVRKIKKIFARVPPLNPEGTDYAGHFITMKNLLGPFKDEQVLSLVALILLVLASDVRLDHFIK
jgi:1-acyl-sn-glycerol-3-phosphate acyltransferase